MRGPVKLKSCGCNTCLTCARDAFMLHDPSYEIGPHYCAGCRKTYGYCGRTAARIYEHQVDLGHRIDEYVARTC